MAEIVLDGVDVEFRKPGKRSEPVRVLDGIGLEIADEEFVCLLGPSGCGKSTALNIIAGFVRPTAGQVTVDGRAVDGPGPDRGVVFQDANIFPWMSVAKNVAFGPSVQGRLAGRELDDRVAHYLGRVGLDGFGDHLPRELSGGMRQRVGLARVLINDPPVMLMDEPFGALDAQTRITMQELLLELWDRDRKTVLFVTHDIDEALLLGDRVLVMSARPGKVKTVVDVPLPRPRSYDLMREPAFAELKNRLFHELRDEEARAGAAH
ncbi:ABC transporter ATP-binding protein [Nonomuraea sp. NPDC050404]|uniref:ABC transporter ATP-binding protein n=1 Tax=Nonomuraea sp. NPDC050404 TaxID=3155783 RepID=UPI0033FB472A